MGELVNLDDYRKQRELRQKQEEARKKRRNSRRRNSQEAPPHSGPHKAEDDPTPA